MFPSQKKVNIILSQRVTIIHASSLLQTHLNKILHYLLHSTKNTAGKIKGWAFGDDKTIACANLAGKFYAVDGRCPRCSFDLYKGTLLVDKDVRPLYVTH